MNLNGRASRRRDQLLNNPLVWVIGGVLISSWLFGAFHAYRDHGTAQGIGALIFPPYGVFMLAEQSVSHTDAGADPTRMSVAELIDKNAAACRSSADLKQQFGFSDDQAAVFCQCIWRLVIENFPPGENEYVDEHGKNSPELERLKVNATSACLTSANAVEQGIEE